MSVYRETGEESLLKTEKKYSLKRCTWSRLVLAIELAIELLAIVHCGWKATVICKKRKIFVD